MIFIMDGPMLRHVVLIATSRQPIFFLKKIADTRGNFIFDYRNFDR